MDPRILLAARSAASSLGVLYVGSECEKDI